MIVLKSLKVMLERLGLYSKDNRKPLEGFKCYHPIAMAIPGHPVLPLLLLNNCFPASLAPKSKSGKGDLIGSAEATDPSLSLVGLGGVYSRQQMAAVLLP